MCVFVFKDFSIVTDNKPPSEDTVEGIQALITNYKVHWNFLFISESCTVVQLVP